MNAPSDEGVLIIGLEKSKEVAPLKSTAVLEPVFLCLSEVLVDSLKPACVG